MKERAKSVLRQTVLALAIIGLAHMIGAGFGWGLGRSLGREIREWRVQVNTTVMQGECK